MIDINTWPPSIAIAFGLAPFVIAMSGVATNTDMACSRDFDLIHCKPSKYWPAHAADAFLGGDRFQITLVFVGCNRRSDDLSEALHPLGSGRCRGLA
ncbi:hypothetical protein D3C77_330000 [compost metagenome]